jgi:hypothetical protein
MGKEGRQNETAEIAVSAVLDATYEFLDGPAAGSRGFLAGAPVTVVDAKFKVIRPRRPTSLDTVLASLGLFIAFTFGAVIPCIAHHLAH